MRENTKGGLRAAFLFALRQTLVKPRPTYNGSMPPRPSPVAALFAAYKSGATDPVEQTRSALSRANGNASRNTYLTLDPDWTLAEAQRQVERSASGGEYPASARRASLTQGLF